MGRRQRELKRGFGIRISRSGWQSLISELQVEGAPLTLPQTTSEPAPAEEIPTGAPAPTPAGADLPNGETVVNCSAATVVAPGASLSLPPPSQDAIPPAPPANTVHRAALFPRNLALTNYWCDHAGGLLLARAIASVTTVASPPQPIRAP